jgi:thymidylate synthase (FAD)
VATEMLIQVKEIAPHIFAKAGPACVYGACPEGGLTCGHITEVREQFIKY